MESGNVDVDVDGKDHGSVEDVNISALYWTEFTGELNLQYFVTTAGPTHSLLP